MAGPFDRYFVLAVACLTLFAAGQAVAAPAGASAPQEAFQSTSAMEASALMAQARLIENSSAVLSSWNYPSSVPCDADFTGRSAWTGITCTSGMVTEMYVGQPSLCGQALHLKCAHEE